MFAQKARLGYNPLAVDAVYMSVQTQAVVYTSPITPKKDIMNTYTFRISLADDPSIWRRVQLTGEQSLRDLHIAIQEALDWEPDDDIAFLLGPANGNADTEYIILDDEDTYDDDDEDEDEEWLELLSEMQSKEDVKAALDQIPTGDFAGASPQSIEDAIALLESNPQIRSQISEALTKQFGIPKFMSDMLLENLSGFQQALEMTELDEKESLLKSGNAAQVSLDELTFSAERAMIYVYGDEEWIFDVALDAAEVIDEPQAEYPLILDGNGESPDQFIFWGDADEDDWDDADEDEDD